MEGLGRATINTAIYPIHKEEGGANFERNHKISRAMEQTALCVCDRSADWLCGKKPADQRLCFHFIESKISVPLKFLAIFCGCVARFV